MVEARKHQPKQDASLHEQRRRRADDADDIRTEFDGVCGSRCVRIEHERSADGTKIEVERELGHVSEPLT